MKPFFERHTVRFQCTRCGRCCVGGGGYYVFLGIAEAEQIRTFLGLSRGWFRRRYLQRLRDGELVIARGLQERCVFLEADGRCRVYPCRPLQCRTYPFWPEVLCSEAAWRREQVRCEGINRGPAVATGRIRKMLQAGRQQTD